MESPCCSKHTSNPTNPTNPINPVKPVNPENPRLTSSDVEYWKQKYELYFNHNKFLTKNNDFYKERYAICEDERHKLQLNVYENQIKIGYLNMIIIVLLSIIVAILCAYNK